MGLIHFTRKRGFRLDIRLDIDTETHMTKSEVSQCLGRIHNNVAANKMATNHFQGNSWLDEQLAYNVRYLNVALRLRELKLTYCVIVVKLFVSRFLKIKKF